MATIQVTRVSKPTAHQLRWEGQQEARVADAALLCQPVAHNQSCSLWSISILPLPAWPTGTGSHSSGSRVTSAGGPAGARRRRQQRVRPGQTELACPVAKSSHAAWKAVGPLSAGRPRSLSCIRDPRAQESCLQREAASVTVCKEMALLLTWLILNGINTAILEVHAKPNQWGNEHSGRHGDWKGNVRGLLGFRSCQVLDLGNTGVSCEIFVKSHRVPHLWYVPFPLYVYHFIKNV